MGVEAAVVRRTLLDVLDGPCEHYDSHKLAYGLAALDRLLQRLEELEGAEARLRETGLHLLAYIDQGDLSGLQFDAIYKDFRAAITREEEE